MRNLFRDERGFTTTSMVLSLLITLALVFTGAQVYRVNSLSADVQDVADAAALAAENQVAEFMIIARFCDAVVLSLSLASLTALGLGIAALCTPVTAELSASLIEAGENLLKSRDQFSDRASKALDKLQEALPYFSAACAAGVAAANNTTDDARYLGIALLVPAKGKPIETETDEASEQLVDDIDENADDIREKAKEAEEAAKQAIKAKEEAFMLDCGAYPNRCLYERVEHLIGISGSMFSSVDTWSFSVAFDRAKEYYAYRRYQDTPASDSAKDLASSELQKRFCAYTYDLLASEGYVVDTADAFEANFPHAPSTIDQMKQTSLYTDKVYPITEEPFDGGDPMPVMHAWAGCPGATGDITEYESIYYLDTAHLTTCTYCEFTVASMGSIAAASTSIDNGFQYYYEKIGALAEDYERETAKANEQKNAVKEKTSSLFDELTEAFKKAADKRIDVSPPGADGAIAFAVNVGMTSAAGPFSSGFVATGGTLGPRAAISASTLLDEGSDEGRNVINSLLDGLREGSGAVLADAGGIVLDIWSSALMAYSNGVDAITNAIETGLSSPLFQGSHSPSGLGAWAAEKLRGLIKDVGLQPAELGALKPVLVNSAHVAAKDEGQVGSRLLAVKQRIVAHPVASTDLFSAMLTEAEKAALDKVDGVGGEIEIGSIEFLGGDTITIPLPPAVKEFGVGAIQGIFDSLRAQHAETAEVRAWE